MSILTKGMYMPPSCYFCPMTNDGLYLCKANNPYRQLEDDCEERRPDWCPLVPVPPHGDLIDRDALEQDVQKRLLICDKNDNQFQRPYEVIRAIALSPAIIPAEEGET